MLARRPLKLVTALMALLVPAIASGQTYSSAGMPIESKGFKSDEDREIKSGKDPNDFDLEKAKDLSGIACLPPGGGKQRHCLVINDEDVFAQRANFDGEELKGKRFIRLIDKAKVHKIRGEQPSGLSCSAGPGKFKNLDGEGVAYSEPYFYVVGSHGCSRHSKEAALSSFILARVQVDDEGKPVGDDASAVQTTYRLNDILKSSTEVKTAYGRDLVTDQPGLNVEGIAAIGNSLYVGLRAPSKNETAYIIATDIDDLFAPGNDKSDKKGKTLPLELGANVGIWDLAPLDRKRLLVLAGPTLEQQDIHFSIHLYDLEAGTTKKLVELQDEFDGSKRGKAEALWPLGGLGEPILVLFDGLKNGGARLYVAK